MLVSQRALLLQVQLLFEETMNISFPPVAGILRVAWLMVRSGPAPAWVTVWVRVMLPAVRVMIPVRLAVEVLGATE